MKDALWSGRIAASISRDFATFQASLPFDSRLYAQDITGSQAHARMLVGQGILTPDEGALIEAALAETLAQISADPSVIPEDAEDIHSAVEMLLRQKIGPLAGKVHTARSRNDQVCTDFRLYVKEATIQIINSLKALRAAFVDSAEHHLASDDGKPIVMPGYTHLQTAQPIHLAHWYLAYYEMLTRDEGRFSDALRRFDQCPLGAAALAGTSWPIDRHATAKSLGFARPMANSLDAVASRDFAIEYLAACANLMVTMSRLSEDLILYNTTEFSFVVMPNAFATGSSIMPQKKNPDLCELTRGKTGRVYGHLMGLLTVMKGLPLAYNKDLQEDKEAVFDTTDTVAPLLSIWAKFIPELTWNAKECRRRAEAGFSVATDLADELARLGLPFREAHKVVGGLVTHCIAEGLTLDQVGDADLARFHTALNRTLIEKISLDKVIDRRLSFGGSSTGLIKQAIVTARAELALLR